MIEEAEAALIQTVSAHSVQIFKVSMNDAGVAYPASLGSGVFLTYNNMKFLITAGHVYEDHQESTMILGKGTGEFIYMSDICVNPVSAYISQTPDIAVFPIIAEGEDKILAAGFSFLSFDNVDINHKCIPNLFYFLYGFPQTRTEIVFKEHTILSTPFSCYFEPNLRRSTDYTIALDCPNKGWKRFNDNKNLMLPYFFGMSGCGVWTFNESGIKLVGIFTEKQKQLLFATRVSCAIDGVHAIMDKNTLKNL